MKKSKPNPKANRNILWFVYAAIFLFLAMGIYVGYFLVVKSDTVIDNPYNARATIFEDRVTRGKILADDGTVLAKTVTATDSNGTEVREYPYGSLFAHAVGYSTVGKTGIESLANFDLLRSHTNLIEQTADEIMGRKSIGDNVVTTLNVNLQQIASDALGKNRGAVIAIEPDTGKILCMVSKPSFDPNKVAANWNDLVNGDSTEARLLNRATQGLYPPGSTFKIVTALEYMREHPSAYNDYHYDCSGIFSFENNKIQCYHKKAHGSQDFTQAFANSCNGAFANLGTELELTSYRNLAEQLLFNRSLPLDIPYNKSTFSMQPDAETWEVLQTGIGQGQTLMSPMHNLLITAAVANGGILMKPYLMDHVENSGGDVIRKFSPSVAGELMVPNEADALKNLMVQVVNVGTGSALKRDSYQVAGKTGSAEFDKGKETHAWFVGFAPADDPKIAVCVIVEEGGSGGHTAAPIAAKLFDAWLQ